MQIVKGDYNSQLRKDKGTHLRKNESPRKYGTLQPGALLRWEIVVESTMAGRHQGGPGRVPCNTQSKEETGERERSRTRCQRITRGQNTNDDDDDDDDDDERIDFMFSHKHFV